MSSYIPTPLSPKDHGGLGGKWQACPNCSRPLAISDTLWNTQHAFTYLFQAENIKQMSSSSAMWPWYIKPCTAIDPLPPCHTLPLQEPSNASQHSASSFILQCKSDQQQQSMLNHHQCHLPQQHQTVLQYQPLHIPRLKLTDHPMLSSNTSKEIHDNIILKGNYVKGYQL